MKTQAQVYQAPGFSWAEHDDWLEVNETFGYLFRRHGERLGGVRAHARAALENLESWFELFNRYCRETCPSCRAACCREARVAYDFRDLLLIHALGLEPPPHQLRRHEEEHCRYLGPGGCGLPRVIRPFVCTWYLCQPLLDLYRRESPRFQREQSARMTTAQQNRNLMEEEFIRVVVQGPDFSLSGEKEPRS
ncbi:MAG: hypothetical protein V1816_21850 [Pseudomonadota bacterium]